MSPDSPASPFDKRPVSRPPFAVLDIEYNELVQAWNRLHGVLRPENQVPFHHPPNDSDLLPVVRAVQTSWMSSPHQPLFTRSSSLCDHFLSSVNTHSSLLSTLPDSDAYRALFYAAIQSVIKASADFPRIAEGLISLLVDINNAIHLPDQLSKDVRYPPIAKFYALTFFFLGEFMDWYVRRASCRSLDSRNIDVYSNFKTVICCIKATARAIDFDRMDLDEECEKYVRAMKQASSHLWEEARLGQVGLQGYERRCAAQNAMIRHLIWEIQLDASQRVQLKMEREICLSQMLTSASGQLRLDPRAPDTSGACLMTTAVPDLGVLPSETSRFDCPPTPKRQLTRTELQLASRHLQDFFESDDQISEFGAEVIAEASILASLNEWVSDSHSQMLAVGGSPRPARISECYAGFARKTKVPVISHFCSLPSKVADGMSAFEHGLVSLAYSLIRQLIDCLPPVLACCVSCDLGADRFNLLDGTLASWKEVLSLIDILLDYAPPLLVCVVDGLDVLRDQSTSVYIQSFIRVFLVHVGRRAAPLPDGKNPPLMKVLFTVSGRANSLVEALSNPLPANGSAIG